MNRESCVANEMPFVIAYFCQRGVELRLNSCVIRWTLKNIHAIWANVWAVIIYFHIRIHALLELWVRPRYCNSDNPSWVKSNSSFFHCNYLSTVPSWKVKTGCDVLSYWVLTSYRLRRLTLWSSQKLEKGINLLERSNFSLQFKSWSLALHKHIIFCNLIQALKYESNSHGMIQEILGMVIVWCPVESRCTHAIEYLLIARTKFSDFSDQSHYR